MSMRDRLKSTPVTGDYGSAAQTPVVNVIPAERDKPTEDSLTDGRAGLLQRKNSLMSCHSNYDLDDTKNVSFGTDPTNPDHPLVMFSPPPEVPITEDERCAYYYTVCVLH